MLKMIAFDFDGTIADTESLWYEVFKKIWGSAGIDLTTSEFAKCVGTQNDEFLYSRVMEKSGQTREEIRNKAVELHEVKLERLVLRDDIVKVIESARETAEKICVVSSSSEKWVRSNLERFHLVHYFDGLFTRDIVKQVKPDPELYLLARDKFHCESIECLAIEDSENGLIASYKAGYVTIVVPNPITANSDFTLADRVFDHFGQINLDQIKQEYF